MKIKLKKSLSSKQIALIVVSVYISGILFYFGFMFYSNLFPKAPIQFDFTIYEDQVDRIDLVDFDTIDDCAVLETLDPQYIPAILTDLSALWFQQSGAGDPPGFGNTCVYITLDNDSYRVVCITGYAQYKKGDRDLTFNTNAWRYIKHDDYEAFLKRYFSRD